MVRIGIVGLGFMGRMHYGAYASVLDAQVTAVCDADPVRAAGDLSAGWSNVPGADVKHLPMDRIHGTTDWRELIARPDVDVVDICLPTPRHHELVTAALAAGKHVLCEKPLARSSAEAQQIARSVSRASGFFMPAMCMRFWSEWEWLRQAVVERRYGAVRAATFRRVGTTPGGWFRDGALSGGALFDLHVHDVDFIHFLFGRPRAVFSRGYSKDTGELDHISTQYLFDEPALVTAEGAWGMADGFGFRMQFNVNFDRATAEFEFGREPSLKLFIDGRTESVEHPGHTGYVGEMRYFVQCVKDGVRPTRVTVEDAVAGLMTVEAEKASVETGRIITL